MYPKSKFRIIFPCIVLLLGGGVYIDMNIQKNSSPKICCNDHCFTIELAQTQSERQRGLMFRETLPEDEGMLFIFDTEQPYSFRMKNTLIPLDMIWINNNLTIVDIQQANPCKTDSCPSFIPAENAQYVLELNQGITQKYGIHIGTQCTLSL